MQTLNNMSLTAKQLSVVAGIGQLKIVVSEQLRLIDEALIRADKTWGLLTVTYELPTIFEIANTKPLDAQMYVYSAIIQSLKKRGFIVNIRLGPECFLLIKFEVGFPKEELAEQRAIIKQALLQSESSQK